MVAEVLEHARVVITGAASGLGALFAKFAAASGASKIVLLDVNEDALADFSQQLRAVSKAELITYCVDLADAAQLESVAANILRDCGGVDVLVNNAGVVVAAPFWQHSAAQINTTMAVNTYAPMLLTQALLPVMLADVDRPKRILNIASAAGTLANPNMSVYAASKWAMIGWSDSLRLELKKFGKQHVRVTTFCPSYIATGMFVGAKGPLLTPIMTPEVAAKAAWEGMLSGKPYVLKPWTVKFAMVLRGILPTAAWDFIAGRIFKVYNSMDNFKGR